MGIERMFQGWFTNPELSIEAESKASMKVKGEAQDQTENLQEIVELREPMQNILGEIRESVNKHEFDLLIGEDASGRAPALLMERFFRSLGGEQPKTIFIAGSTALVGTAAIEKKRGMVEEYMRLFAENNVMQGGKKALIVTDTISSGNGVEPIAKALQSIHKDYVIVTIGIDGDSNVKDRLQQRLGKNIVSGMIGMPKVYGMRSISGVEKNATDLHSHAVPQTGDDTWKEYLIKSRADLTMLGKELADWFVKSNPLPSDRIAVEAGGDDATDGTVDEKDREG